MNLIISEQLAVKDEGGNMRNERNPCITHMQAFEFKFKKMHYTIKVTCFTVL